MADSTDTTRPGEAEAVEAALGRATWTATISAVEVGEVVKVAMSLPAADIATEVVAAAYPVIAAAVREPAEAAAYEQGRRDAHGTIPARIAAAERAVREQAAQDIEAMDEPDWHTGGTLGAEEMGWAWAQDAAARIVRGGR